MRYAPRVKETTTTTSTGTYSLAGADTGFQGFVAGITNTEQTWYCCTNGTNWEIGVGTVADGTPDTLTRDVIVASSNSGSAVNWGAGTKDIFCIFPSHLMNGIEADWHTFLSNNDITSDGVNNLNNIAIGQNNTVSGTTNTAIGNYNTIEADSEGIIALGLGCAAVAESASTFSLLFGSGSTSVSGDSQLKISIVGVETTDATESGIGNFVLSGSTDNTGTSLYEISVVARQTGGSGGTVGDSKAWKLDCMVTFDDGVLAQVGATVSSVIAASTGASAWTCAIDVSDNATGSIRVTGEANKTILWIGYIRSIENSTGITV